MNLVHKLMTPEEIQLGYEKGQLTRADVERLLMQYYSVGAASPLSQNQQGIWSRQAMFPVDSLYHVAVACVVGETFDKHCFRRACQRFVNNNRIVNATVSVDGNQLSQQVDPKREMAWREIDVAGDLPACLESVQRDARAPFSLHDGPLYRINVYSMSNGTFVVLLVAHHIICDGSSMSLWLTTIWQDYRSLQLGQALPRRESGANFFDFVKFESDYVSSAAGQRSLAYWKARYTDGLKPLDERLDLAPGAADDSVFATDKVVAEVRGDFAEQVTRYAGTAKYGAPTVLLGAFMLALAAWRGKRSFTVGLPTLGRPKKDFLPSLGNFVNMMPIACDIDGAQPLSAWLAGCHRYVYQGLDHWYPFAGLLRALPQRGNRRTPLQAVYTYQKFDADVDIHSLPEKLADAVEFSFLDEVYQRDEYPVTCEVYESKGGWKINIKYKTSVISKEEAISLQGALLGIVRHALRDPEATLDALIDGAASGSSLGDVGAFESLGARFSRQSKLVPMATALTYQGRATSYAELERDSSALARRLMAQGVKPGDLVLLCMGASPDLIKGILAIVKAGAAYVPVDPSSPQQRIDYIREDCGARFAVTNVECAPLVAQVEQAIVVDRDEKSSHAERNEEAPWPNVNPADLAYVIYTSGTTGNPKGVMIEQGNVVRLFDRTNPWFAFDDKDVWTLFHSPAFDFSVWEIWGALLYGGRLVVLDKEQRRDTNALLDVLARERVTVFNQTPAAFYSVVRASTGGAEKRALSLRYIIFGGEKLDFSQLTAWFDVYGDGQARLINMYGITETTVHVTYCPVTREMSQKGNASLIGKPIPDLEIHLFDEHMARVPDGEVGEIYVGGAGVARGYLNRPELTAQRFIAHPENPKERLYKTGDLARYLANGELEYIGRNDAQVKIRGFRIELGEIDACMNQHPAVAHCAVVLHEHDGGNKHLVAYYRAERREDGVRAESGDFREFIKQRLPEYMVPAFFIEVDELPVTGNGKIDRKELSRRPILAAPVSGDVAASLSTTQERVRRLWQEVLNVAPAHIDQGFFDGGGDSLTVVFLARALEREFRCEFPAVNLFKFTTVREISDAIDRLAHDGKAVVADPSDAGPREQESGTAPAAVPSYDDDSLAIIGISCEFPGAADHRQLWENILAGKESAERLSPAALEDAGVDPSLAGHPDYVPVRFTIPDKYAFDAEFFGLSAKVAEFADPQSRQLLMHAWKAIEDAGYVPEQLENTGVFVATGDSGYQTLLDNADDIEHNDRYLAYVMAQGGSTSALISYHLGLTGPSMHIGTNCSSSLVAMDAAFKSVRAGECRYALVGASTLFPHANAGFLYQPGLNFSSTGRCRTFDAQADGMMAGEGVAVMLLKSARQAVEDGDAIYAVVRSVAVNNDGRQKSGFYAPSVQGQSKVIRLALDRARGVRADSIAYVEAHGTGTRLGDPAEVMAIHDVYRQDTESRQFCAIGSVKPNVGHLDTAAGLAGCIKVAMALKHRTIPPSINVDVPNPSIDWKGSCFYVAHEATAWPAPEDGQPPRAAVSSFGLGGTNAHAIMEGYPDASSWTADGAGQGAPEERMLVLSARDPHLLPVMARNLCSFLDAQPQPPLDSVAYTLHLGRHAMRHRLAIVARDVEGARALLSHYAESGHRVDAPALPKGLYVSPPNGHAGTNGVSARLEEGLVRGDLAKLAELWTKGTEVPWQELYRGRTVRRVNLPTYPFARTHFSIEKQAPKVRALVGKKGSRGVQFELRGNDFYLRDHVVDGSAVLPAVMTFELVRAAATASRVPDVQGDHALCIERVVWLRPVICRGETVSLNIELPETNGGSLPAGAFSLNGVDPETGHPVVFGEGYLAFKAMESVRSVYQGRGELHASPAELHRRVSVHRMNGAQFYRWLEVGRVQYGPAYKGLVEAGWNGRELSAHLRLDDERSLAGFPLHPGLLDCVLQASVILDTATQFGGDPAGWPSAAHVPQKLPFCVEQFEVLAPLEQEVWVRARRRDSADAAREARYDMDIYGRSGSLLLAIRGFATRAIRAQSDLTTLSARWTPVGNESDAPGSSAPIVLIGAGASPSANLVALLGGRIVRYLSLGRNPAEQDLSALPENVDVVFALPAAGPGRVEAPELIDAQRTGVRAVFRWIKALLSHGFEQRDLNCTFLVERTQSVRNGDRVNPAHASLVGFAQSLAGEYGHWRVRVLDVEAMADLPAPALWPRAREHVLFAWRDGQWYGQKLVEVSAPAPRPTLYRQGGHYLVVGGAGGIGQAWTEYMVRHYQARVIWLGRRPLDENIAQTMRRLGECGPEPMYLQADATDLASLQQVQKGLADRGITELHGIVHSALVLDDQSIANMSEEQFAKALDAKVSSSVHLASVFQSDKLDFVLFFSGKISFVNAPGQCNYAAGCSFQDAFAAAMAQQWRCAVKLMHWGYWGSVGIVAKPEYRRRMALAGIGSLEPGPAMAQLALFMQDNGMTQMAVEKRLPVAGEAVVAAADSSQSVRKGAPSPLLQRVDGLRQHNGLRDPELERAALLEVRRVLRDLDALPVNGGGDGPYIAGPRSRMISSYERWYQESCRQLRSYDLLAREDSAEWGRIRERYRSTPSVRAGVELMDVCLQHLPAILRGETLATSVMFPESSMRLVENVHRNHPIADYFNEGVAEAVVDYVRDRSTAQGGAVLRILEIGAGTGGTSSKVLPRLSPWKESIAEYCYTDLSKSFLFYAQDTYGPDAPFLKTEILNIEEPVGPNHRHADKLGQYDIVIAANVLHATKNIQQTMRNVHAFMRKGGLLVLNEMSENCAFSHLTFGLLDGWWLYDDGDVRIPGCPGLAPEAWKSQLTRCGFADVRYPLDGARPLGQQIIVAQCAKEGAVEVAPPPPVQALRALQTATPAAPDAGLVATVVELVAQVLRVDAAGIDHEKSFSDAGLDSILAIQLTNRLNARFAIKSSTIELFDHNTPLRLCAHLREQYRVSGPTVPQLSEKPVQASVDVRGVILELVAGVLRLQPSDIDAQKSFADYGVDSIIGVQLVNKVNKRLGLRIPTTVIFDHTSVERLAAYLLAEHGAELAPPAVEEAPPAPAEPMVSPEPMGAGLQQAKAVWIEGPGDVGDLTLQPFSPRKLGPHDVRIAVRAFSLNFSDLLCARGLYPNMPPYPFVPGNEASGVVLEVGADVRSFKAGDAVVCLCQGCHATEVVCPASQVFAKPAHWSFEEACVLPIVGITMIDAFKKAAPKPGEKILIQTATGGTGLLALQLAKHHGAEIFATAGSEAKLQHLRELGVRHPINYRTHDFAEEIARLAPGGVDVIINTLGGDALQKGLKSLAPGGRYIEIAMTSLKSAKSIDLSSLSDNQVIYSVDLARLGARTPNKVTEYWADLVSLRDRGIIQATISDVVDFQDFRSAYHRLADRANIGKVVVKVGEPAARARVILETPSVSVSPPETSSREDIAIIGMSGRFARSPDVETFWEHLASGTSLVKPVTRWDLPEGCNTGSFLDDLSSFDPFFFKISGTEARYMDPQQRLFLEEAWKALEDAGYAGEWGRPASCGIYVGCSGGDYHLLFPGPGEQAGGTQPPIQSYWGNATSIIPARISYFLDLQGPAVAIDTACSSSLVALHMACSALRNDEVSMALCGGVFVQCTAGFYQQAQRAGMLSATGNCYTFDARANGFVPGEGVGVVVLKRMKDALADGDHIDGVILGSGINQDGSTNGITAPSAKSQERLEREVYERFDINPRDLQMVEAHGTGTPLGDPIEFSALTKAFQHYTSERRFCALGSVKTNIGHTTTAAGIAGVLKILLALRHRQLPPSCHFEHGNPEIDFDNSPFFVNTQVRPWDVEAGQRRMAAVSSFGFSGTNAHAVIGEAPPMNDTDPARSRVQPVLLVLSAQTREQLAQHLARMAAFLSGGGEGRNLVLNDIGFTLAHGRRHLRYRWACVARSVEEFAAHCRLGLPEHAVAGGGSLPAAVFYGDGSKPAAGSKNAPETQGQALEDWARRYVDGGDLEADLWGAACRRVRLPTYPFARESYWVGNLEKAAQEANPWPPLKTAVAEPGHDFTFSQRLTGQEPFLRDHRVHGQPWLPAVVYWEMIRWSVLQGAQVPPTGAQVVLRNVLWQQPLSLGEGPKEVLLHLDRDADPGQSQRFRFVIESEPAAGATARPRHCSGRVELVAPVDSASFSFLDPAAFCRQAEELEVAACYRKFKELGIEFGDSHRGLQKLFRCRGQILAKISRPEGIEGVDAGYGLSPTLMDGVLQANIANILGLAREELALPYAMDSLTILGDMPDTVWAWIYPSPDQRSETKAPSVGPSYDIEVFDDGGRLLVVMRGCRSARKTSPRASQLHPLVHARVGDAGRAFTSQFDGQEFFLQGHQIAGAKILPAACYLEMARFAGVFERPAGAAEKGILRDIVWLAPFQASTPPASVSMAVSDGPERTCRISSRHAGSDEVVHFRGRWDRGAGFAAENASDVGPDARLDVQAIVQRTSGRRGREALKGLVEADSDFGQPFQVITWLQFNQDEALVHYELPAGLSEPFHWHPGILSACFGAVELWIAAQGVAEQGAHRLPYGIGAVLDYARPADRGYIWVKRRAASKGSAFAVYDIHLSDEQGRVATVMHEYAVRPWAPKGRTGSHRGMNGSRATGLVTGTLCWQDAPASTSASAEDARVDRLFILPDGDSALHELLRGRDPEARFCRLGSGTAIEDAYGRMFEAITRFAATEGARAKHVLMLWPEAQLESTMLSLQALMASAALEYSRLSAKTTVYAASAPAESMDPAYAQRLWHEVRSVSVKEPEVRLPLVGARQVRRFESRTLSSEGALARSVSPGDVVWLVGGMGGIGRHVARYLAHRGVRVILSGRRPEPAGWREWQRGVQEAGALVEYLPVDIANAQKAEEAVAHILAKHGRIDGIIHSAGVVDDAYMRHSTAEAARTVFAAKVHGSANLDWATRALKLKSFVVFSSLSALGSPGQAAYAVANAYLHAWSVQRNRQVMEGTRHGATLAIGWPLWRDGGMAMAPERERMMRERTGLEALDAEQGIDVVAAVLEGHFVGEPEVGVLLVAPGSDRDRIIEALNTRFAAPASSEPTQAEPRNAGSRLQPAEAKAHIFAALRSIIADQQTIAAEKIDAQALFLDLGYDSISLIGLAKDLGARLGLTLQPTLFFEYPALGDLIQYLADEKGVALPAPEAKESAPPVEKSHAQVEEMAPEPGLSLLQQRILQAVSEVTPNASASTPVDLSFHQLGLDSIDFMRLAELLEKRLSVTVLPTLFYEYSSIRSLSEHLGNGFPHVLERTPVSPVASVAPVPSVASVAKDKIAIIGMSCRFPGADNPEEFWTHLAANRDLIGEAPAQRPSMHTLDSADEALPLAAGFVKDMDKFDPQFFGLTPMEAEFMDPQFRMFLQGAWHALEDAGYKVRDLARRRVGVFVGATTSDYRDLWLRQLGPESATHLGLAHFMIANRTSYLFDLRGPSEVLDTACSSSLVAVHRACESLASGNCELAIVGGVNIMANPAVTAAAKAAGMLSPDGRCKTFDSSADGFGRGEGVGVVVLKPVSRAVADGDHIEAIIAASGENHGGRSSSPSAPNPDAQRELIVDTYRRAGIDPSSISYMEAHGTGTALGDPIEVKALIKAFAELSGGQRIAEPYCALGSVKANIGHLEAAAGISALIKTVLMLKHRKIPGNIHLHQPNPYLELAESPFHLPRQTRDWTAPHRRAGISSFGLGGSNAHIVLEEPPTAAAAPDASTRQTFAIGLSARRPAELTKMAENLLTFLSSGGGASQMALRLRDVAFTLGRGREVFAHRLAFLAADVSEVRRKLERALSGGSAADLAMSGIVASAHQTEGNANVEQQLILAYDGFPLPEHALEELVAWARGAAETWSASLVASGKRTSLPTYPFGGKSYWLPGTDAVAVATPNGRAKTSDPSPAATRIHPLVHREESADAGERKFVSVFSGDEFFLADHQVQGRRFLPGVATLEMALTAAKLATAEPHPAIWCVRNVVWSQPVVWDPAHPSVTLNVAAEPSRVRYRILSADGGTLYSQGEVTPLESIPAGTLSIARMQQERDATRWTADACYAHYRQAGIDYGPGHRALGRLFAGSNDVLAELILPECVATDGAKDYQLHPSLLDAAWQAVIGLTPAGAQRPASLPFALDEMRVWAHAPTDRLWAWIRPGRDGESCVDMDIARPDGRICMSLRGLHTRQQATASKEDRALLPVGEVTLAPAWAPVSGNRADVPRNEELWVLGAKDEELRALKQLPTGARSFDGVEGEFVDALRAAALGGGTPLHILWIGADGAHSGLVAETIVLRQERGVLALFRLIKILLSAGMGAVPLSLTVVTRNAHALDAHADHDISDAGIAGLVGCLAHEYPHWAVRHWDIEARQDFFHAWPAHLAATAGTDGDTRMHRHGQWHRQCLLRVVDGTETELPVYREGGVYLVIGGAGGLGRTWSRHMIERFGAHVVWLGRRVLDGEILSHVDELAGIGRGSVTYIQADATQPRELAHARDQILRRFGAIHGLVHAPIVLADRGLAQMDESEFRRSYDAKLKTCIHLFPLFESDSLDFVLFFSSLNAFSKSAGQSNYVAGCTFADAFAMKLGTLLKCPVKVMNWGYWGDVGIVAGDAHRARARAAGLDSIGAEDGLRAIDRLLTYPGPQVAYLKTLKPIGAPSYDGDRVIQRYPESIPSLGSTMASFRVADAPIDITALTQATLAFRRRSGALVEQLLLATLQEIGLAPARGASVSQKDLFERLHRYAPEQVSTYVKWLDQSHRLLIDAGHLEGDGERLRCRQTGESTDLLWGRWKQLTGDYDAQPGYAAQLRLLEHCLRALKDILQGRRAATDVLFPEGGMDLVEGIYKDNPVSDYFNFVQIEAIAAYVQARVRLQPNVQLRLLEVGAGTGGTTSGLLRRLEPWRANIAEYAYTDVSKAFLIHGRTQYGERYPFVRTQRLDLEKPPSLQNIAENHYDVLLATNVLHATSSIRQTLRHIKATLRTSGIAVVNEVSDIHVAGHITFGLLPGWWLSQDAECRLPGGPAVSPEAWAKLGSNEGLRALGFPAQPQHGLGQQIFVLESDGLNSSFAEATRLPEDEKEMPPAPVASKEPANHVGGPSEEELRERAMTFVEGLVADTLKLEPGELTPDAHFQELGLDSILVVQLTNQLRRYFDDITSPVLFRVQTVRALTEYLFTHLRQQLVQHIVVGEPVAKASAEQEAPVAEALPGPVPAGVSENDIAIIGLSGRYPGSPNLDGFWRNLRDGVNCISEIPVSRWRWQDYYDAELGSEGKIYTRWGGFLEHIDRFDPLFFHISPKDAEKMDPQERLFLEEAYRAIEDAGYTPRGLSETGDVGVFVGAMNGAYNAQPNFWSIANRVSYCLDFSGPSMAIDSACSSSLTALHTAMESMNCGSCQVAIVGGVSLIVDPIQFQGLCAMTMLSPGNQCKAFGNGADGFVDGEGVGAMVLKPLAKAIEDGDAIYGVLKGSAINAGGKTHGYTVPNPVKQSETLKRAMARARVKPEDISYIEAHGTGTALGDPIEIEGLADVFGESRGENAVLAAIGSVKSNIGHLESAAGIAGITKVLLQMKHRQLVASLHAQTSNPEIQFEHTPFRIQQHLADWNPAAPLRIAGVSSFGAGGANAHVILSEAPRHAREDASLAGPSEPALLVLSAKTAEGLRQKVTELKRHLDRHGADESLRDVAFTLQVGREPMRHRAAWVATDVQHAVAQMQAWLTRTPDEEDIRPAVRAQGAAKHADGALRNWLDRKDYPALAQAWVSGANVDWRALYGDLPKGPRRCHLPTYPFNGESYWRPTAKQPRGVVGQGSPEKVFDEGLYVSIIDGLLNKELDVQTAMQFVQSNA